MEEEEIKGDNTPPKNDNEGDEFESDDDMFAEADKSEKPEDKKEDATDDKEEDDEDEDENKDKKSKKPSSAVFQKRKYREKLNLALKEIEQLKAKKDTPAGLTEEEKKEKNAKEYLAKTIKEIIKESQDEVSKKEADEQDALEEELDSVLEEHTDFTEKQILEVCEELGVSPRQAVKALERERKLGGKPKPKMPQPKRGDGSVKDDAKKDDGKPLTLESANRKIKELIKKGIL